MDIGLGVWTKAMKDIGFKRVITLEPQHMYFTWLESMSKGLSGLEVLKKDGYDWEAYNELKDPKYIGALENKDWSQGKIKKLFFYGEDFQTN